MAKKYKNVILECYFVLEAMHTCITETKLFDEDLKARAENCIINLSVWNLPNKEDQKTRARMVMTILDQLECNKQLCKKRRTVQELYEKRINKHGRFINIIGYSHNRRI